MKQNKSIIKSLGDSIHKWVVDTPEFKELVRYYGVENRNEKRQRKYAQLRECGYSAQIATKYKDYAQRHVDSLCEIKKDMDTVLWERINHQLGKML